MSRAYSISTRRPFGMSLVCRVWGVPRATVYRHPTPLESSKTANTQRSPRRRGPQGACSDDDLFRHTLAVIEASP